MSYSVSVEVEIDDIPEFELNQTQPEGIAGSLSEHQRAINDTILDLIDAVGTTGKVRITLSGHCNPNHTKTEGWGYEFLSINIQEIE